MCWVPVADIVIKALAVLVGGLWVLFNYIEGRTHRARLQLRVSTERVAVDGLEYLIIKTELSNVGLAKVKILNDGCCVKVYAHQPLQEFKFTMDPDWEELAIVDLFKDQHWVEPSGLLVDQQLVALPGLADRFLRVWTHVESKKVVWNCNTVVARLASLGFAHHN